MSLSSVKCTLAQTTLLMRACSRMRLSNKALGLTRPPSGYALFCQAMCRAGIDGGKPVRRLVTKTAVKTKAILRSTVFVLLPPSPLTLALFHVQASLLAKWPMA